MFPLNLCPCRIPHLLVPGVLISPVLVDGAVKVMRKLNHNCCLLKAPCSPSRSHGELVLQGSRCCWSSEVLEDLTALLAEAGEGKPVPPPTPSLLQACHVASRLLSAVADPNRAVTCYERGQPCKCIPWLRHLAAKSG